MEALAELRRRNKSGDKKANYDAIEKELKVLEILKKHINKELILSLSEEEIKILKDWL